MKLEIGTKLLFETRNTKTINTIVRETPTLWITDKDERIKKSDNSIYWEASRNSYSTKSFKLLTEEVLEELKKEKMIRQIKQNITKFDFNTLDLTSLLKINEIITNNKPKNEVDLRKINPSNSSISPELS